jgi:putative heme utilization radical SAM enzyme HutW
VVHKMFVINDQNPDIVGLSTPDPLRYAFVRKKSAHAGGKMNMVEADKVQIELTTALSNDTNVTTAKHTPRCLYVHIPFCRVRCTFCSFFQYASSKTLMEEYFDALLVEIKWKSSLPWTQSAPFQAIYVGGGTPTDLSASQLRQLGEVLRSSFSLTPDCEITLEGRVNRFTNEKFESALEGGFNRFSFGVQSFDTKVRRSAKRLDDGEHVEKRLQEMAAYNSAPIVIDLLYGLPFQTLENWQQDLQTYLNTGVDGVDLYQLIEMKGLPMEQAVAQGKLPPPADTAMKATMFKMGVDFMAKHHQRRLSINHWSSTNRERSIYNSLAKTTAEVLPIGAGAGGNFSGLNMMQSSDMGIYIEAIKDKQFPVAGIMRSGISSALNSEVKSAFDRGVLSRRHFDAVAHYPLYQALMPLFKAWYKNGLAEVNNDYLLLTLAGQFWSTTMAQNLIGTIQENLAKVYKKDLV